MAVVAYPGIETSEASVVIEGDACDEQAPFISGIRAHRHEMVIYRGQERVWEGPIHRIASHPSYTEIFAHDIVDYLMHTPLTQEYDNRGVLAGPVSTRIGDIIEYELQHDRIQTVDGVPVTVYGWENLDQPANVLPYFFVHHWPNEAETVSYTKPFEMTVGEHLDGLAHGPASTTPRSAGLCTSGMSRARSVGSSRCPRRSSSPRSSSPSTAQITPSRST